MWKTPLFSSQFSINQVKTTPKTKKIFFNTKKVDNNVDNLKHNSIVGIVGNFFQIMWKTTATLR